MADTPDAADALHLPPGRYAVIAVGDTGAGMDDATRARMFEPWWRGDDARTPRAGDGAGLGLAVVQGIVSAHGGTVGVADVPGGCAIEVVLPRD